MIIFHRLAVTYNEETQESIGSIPSKLFPWEFLQAKRAGMEVEFAAEEEDTDSVVVEIVEATSRGFQILNPTIESLSTAFWIRSVLWKMASRPPSLRAPTPRNRSDEHLAEASHHLSDQHLRRNARCRTLRGSGAVELPRLPIACGVSDTMDEAGTDRIKLNTIFTALAVLLGVLAVVTAQSHAAARASETYSDSPHLYRS
jgi:hypothetical protein